MIDIKTISLCIALINIFLSASLFAAWRVQKVYSGFGFWVLANIGLAVGYILLAFLRDSLPHLVAVLSSNLCFVLAAWMRLEGLHRFLGEERRRYPHLVLIALFLVALWYFSGNMAIRTAVVTGVLAYYLFRMTWVVTSHARGEVRALYLFLGSIFLIYGLLLASRMTVAFIAPSEILLPKATAANTLFFLAAMLLDIGVTFAFLMMNDRRLTLELGEAEERLRLTLDATNDGVWDWNVPTGKAVFSPRYYRMLGFEPYEFAENYDSWRSLVHPEDVDRAEAEINRHIREETGYAIEHRMRTKSGGWRWILTRGMVVERDGENRPVRMVGTHSDITDRKRAEEDIRRLNEELESRVLQRTAQLEASNRELESISYSVSHDLRAPLRSIDGFSQALLEEYGDKLEGAGKGYLERVRKATQKMGFLIDDMLKLLRVIRAEFHAESIDLSGMFRGMAETRRKGNPDRVVELVIRQGVTVPGDPCLMQIVLGNLLDNAWKFTENTAHPRIEFGAAAGDGETVCFIRDNGAGFDMAYVDKLFGAFQRLHTSPEFPGTGIGLAMVKRIIARHGGRVRAEGEVGKGATFYFTLPL